MNAHQIVKAAMPNATPEEAEYVLWARTPFPLVPVTARELYRQADRLSRAIENGRHLCELCDHISRPGSDICEQCESALNRAREAV